LSDREKYSSIGPGHGKQTESANRLSTEAVRLILSVAKYSIYVISLVI